VNISIILYIGISRFFFLSERYSKSLLIITLLFPLSCNSNKSRYFKDDGIMYFQNSDKSFKKLYTGTIKDYYSNGKIKSEYSYKEGKENGLFIQWYENGKKKQEGTSYNGEWNGTIISWWENGQKSSEIVYKDDILINVKGRWDQDGSERWTIDSLND
tara:strand:- start:246 stop:719 length:474 start_codon:yes stop_codon:yes gene_type:complete